MKNLIKKVNEKLTMAAIAARTSLLGKRAESSVGSAVFPVEDVHDTN